MTIVREAGAAGRRRVWIIVLLVVLLLWGLTDVRKRARVDPDNPSAHMSDVTVFTGAGAAFFHEGEDPYLVTSPRGWHYLYPPLFGIVMAPLDRLPGSEQGLVFFLISLMLLHGSVVETSLIVSIAIPEAARRWSALFDGVVPKWLLGWAILAVLFPLLNALQRGQVVPFILYPLLLGTRLLMDDKGWPGNLSGGIVLALPVAIKLTPALPVAFVGWVLWCNTVLERKAPDIGKRLGRAAGVTSGVAAGLVLWILLVPAAFVGWTANLGHLTTWVNRVVANEGFDEDNDFFGASRRNQSFHNGVRLLVGTFRDEADVVDVEDFAGKRTRAELNANVSSPRLDRGIFIVRVGMILLLLVGGIRLASTGTALAIAAALGLGAVGSVVFSPLSWGHHYGIVWPAVLFVPLLFHRAGRVRLARVLSAAFGLLTVLHYAFVGALGSIGVLGIGTAVWFVAAIVMLPKGSGAASDAAPAPAT